jgi:Na+-translocating ferredoxin:NAD+ oxidoreductase subunit C
MRLKSFPGGVHPHDNKHFSKNAQVETMPLPGKVVIPLSQHIGAPAKPIVQVGDQVLTGQQIAEPGGFVSIPMHASISGKVTKIDLFPHPTGNRQMAIEITGDGTDEWVKLEENPNFLDMSPKDMKEKIAQAGICGMGGAGFPTHVKLSPPLENPIDTVILNGVECEPYLTSDYRLMMERAEDIISGLKAIMKALNAANGYIGIETNKPDAIAKMEQLVKDEKNIRVVGLKLKYPQGAEKQLIYAATKRKVPAKGGLPLAVGVVVQNVGTAVAVYEALRFGKPLIERVVTLTGKIVKQPKNLKVRIGTFVSEMLDICGGTNGEIGKVISGGPMMGIAIPTLDTPVGKGTSGIVIFDPKEAKKDEENICIHCGRCIDVCPMDLFPAHIAACVRTEKWDESQKAGLIDCMKCGSCAYVCPAHIKIVQWVEIGKQKVAEMQRANK